MEPRHKRRRSADYSDIETKVLIENYVQNYDVLSSKFTTTVTNKAKKEIYEEITAKVNAVGTERRTVEAIKDKWQALKRNIKAKYAAKKAKARVEGMRTGGGPGVEDEEPEDEMEAMILSIIPPEQLDGKP